MTYNVLMGTLNPTHSLTHGSADFSASNVDETDVGLGPKGVC